MAVLLCIFLLALLFSRGSGKQVLFEIPAALQCVMLEIYLISLLKGFPLLTLFFYAELLLLVIFLVRERESFGKSLKESMPGLLLLLFVSLLCVAMHYGRHVVFGDDMRYFAIFPKTVFFQNMMPDGMSCTYSRYASYTPILGLFYAAVLKAGFGGFREWVLFALQSWVEYLFLIPVLGVSVLGDRARTLSGSKQWKIAEWLVRAGIYLLFPFAVGRFISALNVDYVVGIAFVGCIFNLLDLLKEKEDGRIPGLRLSLSLAVLSLIKQAAVFLAVNLLVILFIGCFLKRRIKPVILPTLSVLAASLSWSLYCRFAGLHSSLSSDLGSRLKDYIRGRAELRDNFTEVNLHFLKAFLTEPLSLGISSVILCFIVLAAFLFLLKKGRLTSDEKIVVPGLLLGYLLYQLELLVMYQFGFSPTEAYNLAGYCRYSMMYAYGMFGLMLYLLLYRFPAGAERENMSRTVMPLLFAVLFLASGPLTLPGRIMDKPEWQSVLEELGVDRDSLPGFVYGERVILYGFEGYTNYDEVEYEICPLPCIINNQAEMGALQASMQMENQHGKFIMNVQTGEFMPTEDFLEITELE